MTTSILKASWFNEALIDVDDLFTHVLPDTGWRVHYGKCVFALPPEGFQVRVFMNSLTGTVEGFTLIPCTKTSDKPLNNHPSERKGI